MCLPPPFVQASVGALSGINPYSWKPGQTITNTAGFSFPITANATRLAIGVFSRWPSYRQLPADQALAMAALAAVHADLRAALGWAAVHDRSLELRLVVALARFWFLGGHWLEALGWYTRALEATPDGDPDLRFTAVRETWEEIGVATDHVEVIGQLDEMVTVSNFLVRPFVGRITQPAPYPFVHSEIEVAEILEVPLNHLRDESNLVAEPRIYQGRQIIAYSFHWRDHVIWGATARILKQFLELI